MSDQLTHLNTAGEAHMVDVSEKAETTRVAVAQGVVRMRAETLDLILAEGLPKGMCLRPRVSPGLWQPRKRMI